MSRWGRHEKGFTGRPTSNCVFDARAPSTLCYTWSPPRRVCNLSILHFPRFSCSAEQPTVRLGEGQTTEVPHPGPLPKGVISQKP
jgi:hypothetical protein